MRYTGAVIGLAIGYIIKYLLDKRFVFNNLDDRRAMNL
jgi:putative flippase GtrA